MVLHRPFELAALTGNLNLIVRLGLAMSIWTHGL
jgi:hypothetical protein